ncbi:hypothetical protein KFK09_015567 [Dendrobium nobile]|uniref:GHMP kinase N-terminal domain-containing protein n=1 Tax=Dendrobium nobile TaxID=94219 RepID=A0A8T3B6J9_DENNO|nr:hypothetical protein KFK09_015567 [Dendrobium nobile]
MVAHRISADGDGRGLVFAYYITGHGFGHATRVVDVVRHLVEAGHDVHVVTAAPEFVFTTDIQSPNLYIRKVLLDSGAVQTDALTVDRLASLEKYLETAVVPRASILATEVEWLKSIKADLVISDVVPVACRAAADAGIRSVCVTNFSWDFIYAEYVMAAGNHLRSIVLQIAEDYSHCEFLLRLPGYCPMPAFRDVIDVPLVVRRLHKSRLEVCGASDKQVLPPNFIKLAKDAYTPDLIAASDCMLGKIGYGTFSEALAYKLPFVFVRRDYFNEEHFLRNMLEYYQGGVEMIRRDLLTGHWKPYLERALTLSPCYDGGVNGGELSGARRLRDAIILGYQLQRSPGRDISIPDWYTQAENELGLRSESCHSGVNGDTSFVGSCIANFEILHGELHGLSDTLAFLKSLSALDCGSGSGKNTGKRQLREQSAAAALFNWEEDIFVARAPGRLDVMGGIADYSGSLVLQVSFGSELSNRAPTFDMDLSDFLDGDQPISYEKAYRYFAQDQSQKWAAYVAGTILVLMTELGVHVTDSICILVSSAVPEGKGVSSSAAVEVATMQAVAASLGLEISPRDLALLCQKVENHIVGAPCGVMDQMTSACGEANKLLAMVCQLCVLYSVGGGDYGSVRVGAFMGRKMIKAEATALLKVACADATQQVDEINPEYEEFGVELLKREASLEYLCNLSTHRYQAAYMKKLPDGIPGEQFLKEYGDHNDKVTIIDPKHNYGVKAATKHPIYENFRVETFKALLTAATTDEQLSTLGELMYQCHYSYSDCGLGSDGTDRLVKIVQEMQLRKSSHDGRSSLFGAKITGGGSGGTVSVIGRNSLRSSEEIFELQQRYKAATGYLPLIFEGSSPGAGKFGYLKIRRRQFP